LPPHDQTIFALATGPGRAAVAIIRLSGPAAGAALEALTGRERPTARRASPATLRHPVSGELLDHALALWFPTPASYTGEDVVELQLHGGRAVVHGVTEALASLPGLRPAEPGEFTRRAFAAGKFDLTSAEAVADLIDADTAAQRRQALRQLGGELGRLYDDWRKRLVGLLAHLEALIDFPDEDLPEGLDQAAHSGLLALIADIGRHLQDSRRGERLRDGLAVAIIGPPNAGKSSLLNRLARREAAIVSAQSGTTRDVIEVHLDMSGYPVILADTAGLRESTDLVESEGIRRAFERASDADIKIAVFDGDRWPDFDSLTAGLIDDDTLMVVNKLDHHGEESPQILGRLGLGVSARSGAGVDILLERLGTMVAARLDTAGPPPLTRLRHRLALEDCREALARAMSGPLPELVAEDVRLATRALGSVTGRVAVDEVLDVIFRDFCLGK
jgi:tRNA modification GTPase